MTPALPGASPAARAQRIGCVDIGGCRGPIAGSGMPAYCQRWTAIGTFDPWLTQPHGWNPTEGNGELGP